MGVLLSILTSFFLGTSDALLKKSFAELSPSISFLFVSIFGVLLWAPVGLLLGVRFDYWLLGIGIGLFSAIFGEALYVYALEKGQLSVTATILSSFSIYTIIFSILFNGERPSILTFIFIVTAILGTVIVSWPDKLNSSDLRNTKLILLVLFVAMLVGASDTVTKNFIDRSSVGTFLFFVALMQIPVALVYLKLEREPLNHISLVAKKFSDYKYAIWGSLLIAIATMFLFLSFNFTLASIASPIAASSPIVTIILAYLYLHEKVSVRNLIGLTLVIVAVIAIGITTNI